MGFVLKEMAIAIENDHRNSGFPHWTWWFSIVMLVYQRVINRMDFLLSTRSWLFEPVLSNKDVVRRQEFCSQTLGDNRQEHQVGTGTGRCDHAIIFYQNMLTWAAQTNISSESNVRTRTVLNTISLILEWKGPTLMFMILEHTYVETHPPYYIHHFRTHLPSVNTVPFVSTRKSYAIEFRRKHPAWKRGPPQSNQTLLKWFWLHTRKSSCVVAAADGSWKNPSRNSFIDRGRWSIYYIYIIHNSQLQVVQRWIIGH
jgi:hypothetical protein